jgi:hypothetical protein
MQGAGQQVSARSLLLCGINLLSSASACRQVAPEQDAPTPEQIAVAIDTLIPVPSGKAFGNSSGAAVEELAFGNAVPTGVVAPVTPALPAFQCGEIFCWCSDDDSFPADLKDKVKCEGMGLTCLEKRFVAEFPCTVTQTRLTVCVCRKPKKKQEA